ncbi:glycosyltransferase [Parapedobacter sp. 10938]|uniref:glycosyltransferase n=1 Tax=Parapedobacter flavus TaxID=3110225 RepID=UPI002DBB8569|nr:glycosyltransferase [Parapedobacter sp. 10938]MEC3881396.1 glycosyltransferase [Parapedobacter sp. 10938]
MHLSVIVPVFNRPNEIKDLLDSLTCQTDSAFEVVIVEDGSTHSCETVAAAFQSKLDINYLFIENAGPGPARNAGSKAATGDYLVFLDSDCVLPEHYIETLRQSLASEYADAFGGPDQARADFTLLQRAINYSMTSFFTTGGIRGGSEKLDKFHPRSFNMGYSKAVFERTGGFSAMRFGEDIDMSIRVIRADFRTRLIKQAYVYHRRRTSLRRFFKQVYNSGIARINLYKRHPHSLKVVHLAPAVFTLGVVFILALSLFLSPYFLILLLAHAGFILVDAAVRSRNFLIGLLAVVTSYVQLLGYGMGFIHAFLARIMFRKGEFAMFQRSFYE